MANSSDGSDDENERAILVSPGGLVWVRRKDKSWWPGQVVRPNEVLRLSSSSSQRSGTSIGLLGRSVVGRRVGVYRYNLGRKRHVRPFRCTEFGRWIEEAKEASQKNKIDKRSKDARRIEAILQALEIEEQFLRLKMVNPKDEDEDSSKDNDVQIRCEDLDSILESLEARGSSEFDDDDDQSVEESKEIIDISSDSKFLSGHQSSESNKSRDKSYPNRRRSNRKRTPVAHVQEFLEMEKQTLWCEEVAKSTTTKTGKGLSPSLRRRNDSGSTRMQYRQSSTAANAISLKIEGTSIKWQQKGKRGSRSRTKADYLRKKVIPEAAGQDKGVKKEKKHEGVSACVPLNLVFDRINVAVDRQSARKI